MDLGGEHSLCFGCVRGKYLKGQSEKQWAKTSKEQPIMTKDLIGK
jgi:hypothetical protein